MPMRPARVCAMPGCSARVPAGYCDQHQAPRRDDQQRFAHLYQSRRWRRESARFLRAKLCIDCRAEGRIEAAIETDHEIPHRGDPVLFWDRTNWRPRCKAHHSAKTWRETLGKGADITGARSSAERAPVKPSQAQNPQGAA